MYVRPIGILRKTLRGEDNLHFLSAFLINPLLFEVVSLEFQSEYFALRSPLNMNSLFLSNPISVSRSCYSQGLAGLRYSAPMTVSKLYLEATSA